MPDAVGAREGRDALPLRGVFIMSRWRSAVLGPWRPTFLMNSGILRLI